MAPSTCAPTAPGPWWPQKVESPSNPQAAWDIYKFDRAAGADELTFVSKHDED